MQDKNDALSLLKQAEHLPLDGCDDKWLYLVTKVLRLPGCYVPAAQKVLSPSRNIPWGRLSGKGQNPVGYVKTAVCREALVMGLALDGHREAAAPLPPQKKLKNPDLLDAGLRLSQPAANSHNTPQSPRLRRAQERSASNEQDDHGGGAAVGDDLGTPGKRQGKWWGGDEAAAEGLKIPEWLQLGNEPGFVDWDKVARHAVLKAHMAPMVARALKLKASGVSRPVAVERASTPQKARDTEAAWKWIDRNWESRIIPLFKLDGPPLVGEQTTSLAKSRVRFIPPGSALSRIIQKSQPRSDLITGPSLTNIDRLGQLEKELGLPKGFTLAWDGMDFLINKNYGGNGGAGWGTRHCAYIPASEILDRPIDRELKEEIRSMLTDLQVSDIP